MHQQDEQRGRYLSFTFMDLRKLDLPTIDREIESLKADIEATLKMEIPVPAGLLGVGGNSTKKMNIVGKNEIVHEYLYDSEEEALKVNTDMIMDPKGLGVKPSEIRQAESNLVHRLKNEMEVLA